MREFMRQNKFGRLFAGPVRWYSAVVNNVGSEMATIFATGIIFGTIQNCNSDNSTVTMVRIIQ
jgi:hypothetical protein